MPCGSQDSAACRNWASDQRELLFQASECHCSEFGPEQAAEGAGQGREARAFEAPKRVQKSLGEGIPTLGGKWRGDLWVASNSQVCVSERDGSSPQLPTVSARLAEFLRITGW